MGGDEGRAGWAGAALLGDDRFGVLGERVCDGIGAVGEGIVDESICGVRSGVKKLCEGME